MIKIGTVHFFNQEKTNQKIDRLRILKPAVASDGIFLMVLPVKWLFKMCGPVKNYPFHHRPPLKIHYAGRSKTLKPGTINFPIKRGVPEGRGVFVTNVDVMVSGTKWSRIHLPEITRRWEKVD